MVSIGVISTGLVGALIFIGVLLFMLSKRTRAPFAVLLLLLGLFIGPLTGFFKITIHEPIVQTFAMIALAVVLFEAGYEIKFSRLKKEIGFSMILTVLTVFFSVLAAVLVAKFLFRLDLIYALLLGALVASTDLTLIYPAIKNLRIKKGLIESLELEATLNSVFAAVIAVIIASAIAIGKVTTNLIIQTLTTQFVLGAAIGLIVGWVLLRTVRHLTAEQEPEILSIAVLLVVFAIAEFFGASGIIAVLVVGILFGNSNPPAPKIIKSFGGSLEVLLLIFVYILLGAVMNFSFTLTTFIISLIFVFTLMGFRYFSVLLLGLEKYEQKITAFAGARGLVSAVLIITYAGLFPDPSLIINVGFLTIFITSIAMLGFPLIPRK